MNLSELRNATREEHKRIEQSLDLMRPSFTVAQYWALLLGYWDFLHLWEPRILDVMVPAMPGFAGPRMKLAWLELDLRNLETRFPSMQRQHRQPTSLPALNSVPQALGSMYVLEGSALGGQILSRHFEKHLGLTQLRGCRYLSAYGPDTGVMWRGFCEVLETRPRAEGQEMASAAVETFQILRRCLSAGVSA